MWGSLVPNSALAQVCGHAGAWVVSQVSQRPSWETQARLDSGGMCQAKERGGGCMHSLQVPETVGCTAGALG